MSSVDSITITNTDQTNQIEITSTDGITVTTVGTQGLAGPSAIMARGIDQTTATVTNNGALLVYDHGNEKWTASNTTEGQLLTQSIYNLQLGGSGITVTTILDEDNMASDSATALASQQSIKAYVDNELTAADLDLTDGDGNNLSIDLDSQTLGLIGGDGIDSTISSTNFTFSLDSTVARLSSAQTFTNKTLTSPVLNGSLSGTAFLDEDNFSSDSAVAVASQQSIKAYVDAQITLEDLDITDGTNNGSIDLDSEVFGVLGGTGVDSNLSGNNITLSIDNTVVTLTGTQTLTNKTLTQPKINDATAITSTGAELNILDGATVTTGEVNILDGDTSASAVVIVDADQIIVNDNGTMKQLAVTRLDTYVSGTTATLTNKTLTSPVLNGSLSGNAFLDEDNLSSNSATKVASQQSIKAYVDSQVTAQDLDVSDGTTDISIDLDSETLSLLGGTGVTSTASGNGVTFAIGQAVATTSDVTFNTVTADVIGNINGATEFSAQAGEALTKGDAVYISGISGNTPVVSKADADDSNKMPSFGLAKADANNNASVTVITFGTLAGLDTSSFSAGDTLFISTTAGTLTASAPSGESSLIQNIGKVQRSHASAGSIKVGGAGRTNATPNLNNGKIFLGNGSNQSVSTTLDTSVVPENTNLYYTTARANSDIDARVTNTFINDLTGVVADTATALATARTIGGVSFDGTANIDLAGVNTTGNQDTSGNAATATALETARTIGGTSFDGTADIAVALADTATALATGRTIALAGDVTASGVSFDGTGNISLTTTISANSVALGTDTTGDYVGTITGGTGIDSNGATSGEGIAHTLSLNLNELTTETTIADDDFIAMVDATDNASGKITFENLEDAIFSSVSGDVLIAEDGAATIQPNSVALSTDTTGNYIATVTGTANEVEVTGSGSEGATITIGLPDDVTISGDLVVNGTTTTTDTDELHVDDPLIKLAKDNTANSLDIGFYGQYRASGSTNQFTGLFRDQNDSGKYKLFELLEVEPTTTVNTGGTGYTTATLVANLEGAVTGNASTATTLATARAIALTGDVVGTADFDGSAGISISTTIQANSVALGTDTTGNYIATIAGTSNEIEVSGSGSESATVTVGLPSATEITTSLGIGGGSTNGVEISQGAIAIKNGGTQSNIDFYCEVSNAHYARLQAPAHSQFSGNVTLTLPTSTGTLVGSGDSGTVSNTMLANSSVNFGGVTVALGASDTTPAFNLQDATGYPTSSLTGTITNAQLAGSIANAKLANSTVSFGGISLALGASDATPAFDLADATNYPTSSLTGTITNAQLDGSIANAKLANSSITVGDGSNTTAVSLGGTITYAAGEGLDVAESSGTITYSAEDATSSNKGIASFAGDFAVSSGAVSLGTSGVTADTYGSATAIPVIAVDAKGRITSASTANISTSFTLTDGTNSQTIGGGDTLTVAGTSNEVDVAVSATDTLTIGLPDDVTISNDLVVTGDLTVSGTTTQTGPVVTDNNFTGLANSNTGNATDFGFYGKYVESATTKYGGMFYDASTNNTFRIFVDTQTQPSTTVNTGATGYAAANLIMGALTTTGITIGSTAVTSTGAELNILDGVTSTTAELNILDGVTATTAEINILDGDTSATSTTLADADRVVVNDNGTMKQVALTDFETYFETSLDTLNNVTSIGTLGSLAVSGDVTIDTNVLKVDSSNNRVGIGNASPDVSLDIGSYTDAIHVPVGTTAQRPSSPAAGYFRYNTTTAGFEGYTDEWGAIAGGGGGASAMETDNFTGNGSTTAFTLSSAVSSEDNLIVFIEGVFQNKATYAASGTTITFATAPANTRKIVVFHVKTSISGTSMVQDAFTGNGSTTAYTLSALPNNENNTQVYIDGVYQNKATYSTSGTTLTFDTAPANSAAIEVMMFAQTTINVPASNAVTTSTIADGNVTTAKINDDAVTLAKMAGLARGKLIVGDASGNPSALAAGSANYVLTSDGTDISWAANDGVTTINNNADNRIITGSGTANTLNGEANLTFDSSLVITKSEGAANSLNDQISLEHTSGTTGYHIKTIRAAATDNPDGIAFVESTTERMRIRDKNVGIGTTALTSSGGYSTLSLNGSTGGQISFQTGESAKQFIYSTSTDLNIYNNVAGNLKFFTSGTERIRIDSSGNVGIGTTSPNGKLDVINSGVARLNIGYAGTSNNYYDADSHYFRTGNASSTPLRITTNQVLAGTSAFGTGVLAYDRDIGAPNMGMNITENTTFNDASGHSFSSKQNTHGVIYIAVAGVGFAAIPFYPNAGGGVGYTWNVLDPDNGTWTYGAPTISFTLAGTGSNAFTLVFASGSGVITVTRTSGSSLYRVVFMEFYQQ